MNLKQLETLYWIERLGSFTAAAERLDATQSTVSARIQELEAFLGVTLFDRSHRVPRLTPKGKEMAVYARQLIDIVGEMRERAAPESGISGRVRVGASELVARTWLPRFMKTLQDRHPNIVLELEIGISADIGARLRSGDLDAIFAVWSPRKTGGGYVSQSLGSVTFEWVASPTLGVPERSLKPSDLEKWPILTLGRHTFHHAAIEQWMKRHDIHPPRLDMCNSTAVLAGLAAAGLGVTALPIGIYSELAADGRLVPLDLPTPLVEQEFYAVHAADQIDSAVKAACAVAVEVSDFEGARGKAEKRNPGRAESKGRR